MRPAVIGKRPEFDCKSVYVHAFALDHRRSNFLRKNSGGVIQVQGFGDGLVGDLAVGDIEPGAQVRIGRQGR